MFLGVFFFANNASMDVGNHAEYNHSACLSSLQGKDSVWSDPLKVVQIC